MAEVVLVVGPCGPCSEIYYDRGVEYGCDNPNCAVGCDCDRFIEFWNLVFTQFEKQEDGTYTNLAKPNIDTGMGLERVACIMQDVTSIFDIDTLKVIIEKVCQLSGLEYEKNNKYDISIRLITDHIRSVVFMISDGVLASNEGRGYVLRRLLRRAAAHGKIIGIKDKFLTELAKIVIECSKDAYSELEEKREYILKLIQVEESKFYETLDQGKALLENYVNTLKEQGFEPKLRGEVAFKLYDTFGFPLELVKEFLAEENIEVDEEGFYKEMEIQKERARSARSEHTYMGTEQTVFDELDPSIETNFLGYDLQSTDGKILYIIKDNEEKESAVEGDEVSIITDKTTMYAEGGGQKGDIGEIKTATGLIEILDCKKVGGNKFAHIGKVVSGKISLKDDFTVSYNKDYRKSVMRNHTAAHLLQQALKDVVGDHVEQAGSNVSKDRLRFDFTHFSSLNNEELEKVERKVNEKILEGLNIEVLEKTIEEAKEMKAIALFGEKYGDSVRVVNISEYSIELCAGTHVKNTSELGLFKILSEAGIASGVRRIEAITGEATLNYYKELDEKIKYINNALKATPDSVIKKLDDFIEQNKKFNKELEKMKAKASNNIVSDLLNESITIKDVKVLIKKVDNMDMNALRMMVDKVKESEKSIVTVLVGKNEKGLSIVVAATDDLVKKGVHCGNIIKDVASILGGKGGGRPNMAQAGGKDESKIVEAFEKAKEIINNQL